MEEYQRIVALGNMGDETALKDLGLEGIQEVSFIPHSKPTMETMTAEYSRAKRVAIGARVLEVGLVEKVAVELMMFLDFLASFLFKSKISVKVDSLGVGRTQQIRISHIKKWYDSIGEVSEEGREHHCQWLSEFIGQAVDGDPKALRFFSLDEPPSMEIGVLNSAPNVTTLKMHFRRAKECAAVGKYLGDGQRRWKEKHSGDEDGSSTTDSDDGSEISKQNAADPNYEPEEIKAPKTKDLRVTATNIRKFIVTVLQENKTAGADFDESGVRIAMCHTQKTVMYSYLREDLTTVASRVARTIKQFTDRSSNGQSLDKQVNKEDVALEKERSTSGAKAPSHSTEFSEASCAQQFADKSSNGQPLQKAADKEDVAVEKEKGSSGVKASRPLTGEEKNTHPKYIQGNS
ncbi:hypothetical protein ACROYT_G014274 [Oculina patagonica]